jgi:class 3 adenylate cyclase/tetratricopeptide (TPR) repeat protein
MRCGLCEHDNQALARFCGGCGTALACTCAACGHANPVSNRFCDACGAGLPDRAARQPRAYTPPYLAQKILTSRSALEGERKQVTVLFCDLANSTELAQQVGAEAMHDTLNAFFALAMAEVHRVEGTVNQFLGDGFMALFGAPLAHEDHVRRALHCALAIRQRLQEATADASKLLASVRVRMGLNTGSVVVGRIGDNLRMDYTAIGDTTNIAARLQQRALPGGICVSDAVQAAGSGHFDFESMGPQSLKGVAKKVHLYELLRARAGGDAAAPDRTLLSSMGVSSPLVGRNDELAVLGAALSALQDGQGSLLLLEGEPGVGKSRLMAEARRLRPDDTLRWLEGRSLSFGRQLSYWPFIQLLKASFHITEDDGEQTAWGKLEQGLRPLFGERTPEVLPYLATVLALPIPPAHEERLKYLDGIGLRRQVFLCFRQLIEGLSQRQPLVLCLEDWHWADQSSVDLADHLLALTTTLPLLLVFAARPQPDSPLQRVRDFAAQQPAARLHDLRLVPLSAQDSTTLMNNLAGTLNLPLALREKILRKTEGNPFFLEEVIRSLISEGALVRHADSGQWQLVRRVDDVQLPDTLQGLILARIDRLADESKQALKLASVIGRSFFDRVLEAISETRGELRRCLSDLQQAELIREKQRLPDLEYMFKHALVQEATYGSILADNRRAIHQRVAQSIEALFPDRLDEFATLLAHHYTCAEDWEKAQAYLFKAGDQAGRMAADTEALEHLRLAEAAYLKARGDKLEPLQRAALARKVGAALFGTGRYEAAHEQMRQALSHLGVIYPSTRAGVLRAALGYLGAHGWRVLRARLGWPAPRRMDLAVATEISTIAHMMAWSDYFLDKERMLLDSLLELHVGECSEHALAEARGLSAVGFGMMTFGARKLARRYHHRAQGVAQRSANVSAIAFSWFALAFVDFYDGHWDPFDTRMGKAVTGYRESGDLHRWGSPAMMVSWVQIARGDLERARTLMTEVVRVGKDAADPQISSWGLQVLGRALIALGPLSEAEAALREGADIALRIHSLDNLLHLQAMLVSCLVLQGRLAECPPLLDEAHAIIRREKMDRDFDAVEVLVADARYRLALAESLQGAPRKAALDQSREACRVGLRCARRMPLWLPTMLRLQGRCDWLRGDTSAAARAWHESLKVAERASFPVERGLTLLEIGRRTDDASRVRQAAQLFRQTGAHTYLALAEPTALERVPAESAGFAEPVRRAA